MTHDEARNLPMEQRKAGLKVEGSVLPWGGSWIYDKNADELTLREPPTSDVELKGEQDHAG